MLVNSTELTAQLRRDYFSDPSRHVRIAKGEKLMETGQPNERLYYIISGIMAGTIPGEDDLGNEEQVELFRSGPGDFIGVVSFFSQSGTAFMCISAVTDAELAWIDLRTQPVNPEKNGSIRRQFLPIILHELVQRQISLSHTARERESALRRLHLAENLSTLGRLSAGIAHELNNAIGVLSRSAEHVQHVLANLLSQSNPDTLVWFERGVAAGQEFSSETVRRQGRDLAKKFDLPYDKAKKLARIMGDVPLQTLPDNLDAALELWETGRVCHDMHLAAHHAGSIVKSVRELGGSSQQRAEGIDVNATLREAGSLLKSSLRKVRVSYELDEALPPIWGNSTELAQIWINILRNGCDALDEAKTPNPSIHIETLGHRRGVQVTISNNGPRIPDEMRRRLFQPHITTKGGSMGMGLGLYLIKRLVDSYCGELLVASTDVETRFTIHLPLEHRGFDFGN